MHNNPPDEVSPSDATEPVIARLSALVCQACDWRGNQVAAAIGHEHNRHDAAQTVWFEREVTP